MTNTETPAPAALSSARWVTSSRSARSGYGSVYELLRVDADPVKVRALFDELTRVRGAHRVSITQCSPEWVDGKPVPSRWFSLSFYGTDRAIAVARGVVAESKLINEDRNADHDHARCVASAQKLGVPAEWAHRVETYLSM